MIVDIWYLLPSSALSCRVSASKASYGTTINGPTEQPRGKYNYSYGPGVFKNITTAASQGLGPVYATGISGYWVWCKVSLYRAQFRRIFPRRLVSCFGLAGYTFALTTRGCFLPNALANRPIRC